ncbi:ABC transporter permease [Halocatena salina]|uniref:ABC transporter permease n=1 Tax=Halocatena salina TaxID=2934340 RepID=A0A8U0A8C2_9EURY|nr:ABC transporter permease [Halocatena salina]
MRSLQAIARKDFTDSLRTRSLWVITGLMTLLIVSTWWANMSSGVLQQVDRPFTLAIAQFSLWLPLAAIGVGFKSIVGERSSGSIRVLLGQPCTRRDVVFGTYAGRSLILVASVLIPLLLLSVLVITDFGTIAYTEVLGGTLALLLYALAWIGMTVGVSSSVTSESRTIGLLIGIYALVEPLWTSFVLPLCSFIFTGSRQIPSQLAYLRSLKEPTWYLYVNRLSPSNAFNAARHYVPDLLEGLLHGTTVAGPHAPNVFGIVVLSVWMTVPVFIGYRRFKHTELG